MSSRLIVPILSFFILLIAGCGSKFSPFLSESWSVNYALASQNAEASQPEINDGDMRTWGVTEHPNREYTITFPEEKKINRIVIYSGNVISYKLFCWNKKMDKWELVGGVDRTHGRQRVYSDLYKLEIPRFDHRVNLQTDKIKLIVDRTDKDGVVTTRTPGKNDTILEQRTEFIQVGRDRVRITLYDVFMFSKASIREIEAYSHAKEPGE